MENNKLPNTFLIGAQKAATTSVYSWLSQHPDICAPMSVKDYAFFTRDDFFEKGLDHLSNFYKEEHNNEKIVLQGSVHYIFFEKALKRINRFNPNAKFILILRNPIERALSAYEYAIKFDYENLSINEAFKKEDERMTSTDHRTLSELTYKNHGLYYEQIQIFLKYFKRNQLKVVLYEEVSNPELLTSELFKFLNVDSKFTPEYKAMNITGKVKSQTIQKVFLGDNKVKNWLVHNVANKLLSQDLKAKLRWKIIHLNTNKNKVDYLEQLNSDLKNDLLSFFKDDIDKLELFLSKDLSHWKR